MKKRMNKKGFTLIELLAVIIILAILMTLAITAMSGYIRGARKDTFVTTAQQYANSVRLSFVNGEYAATVMPSRGQCLAVSTNTVALESGSHESPFGQAYSDNSYIIILNDTTSGQDKYEYFVQMSDAAGNGFGVLQESTLDGDLVIEKDVSSQSNFQSNIKTGGTINLYTATSNTTFTAYTTKSCQVSGVIE